MREGKGRGEEKGGRKGRGGEGRGGQEQNCRSAISNSVTIVRYDTTHLQQNACVHSTLLETLRMASNYLL